MAQCLHDSGGVYSLRSLELIFCDNQNIWRASDSQVAITNETIGLAKKPFGLGHPAPTSKLLSFLPIVANQLKSQNVTLTIIYSKSPMHSTTYVNLSLFSPYSSLRCPFRTRPTPPSWATFPPTSSFFQKLAHTRPPSSTPLLQTTFLAATACCSPLG